MSLDLEGIAADEQNALAIAVRQIRQVVDEYLHGQAFSADWPLPRRFVRFVVVVMLIP